MNWEKRLKEQVDRKFDNYARQYIDLSVVNTNKLITLAGEFLYVEKTSSPAAAATVRLNMDKNPELIINSQTWIETVFTSFYLTNIAQAGQWMIIIVGIDFHKEDQAADDDLTTAQPIVTLTAADVGNHTGPNAPCSRAMIESDILNTGLVKINFKQSCATAYFLLSPGMAISVSLASLSDINYSLQVINEKVNVVYEN